MAIFSRFLQTHALVGLRDVLDRYSFEPTWAERKLEEWCHAGRLVAVPANAEEPSLQWSAPDNLEQEQRASLSQLSFLRQDARRLGPGVHPDSYVHNSRKRLGQSWFRLWNLPQPQQGENL